MAQQGDEYEADKRQLAKEKLERRTDTAQKALKQVFDKRHAPHAEDAEDEY